MLRHSLFAFLALAAPAHAIVGGTPSDGPLARSSVMVLGAGGFLCSGVVVAPDVVLTAAHCVAGRDVRVHFRGEDGAPVLIKPVGAKVHPGYRRDAVAKRTTSIDLAALKLPNSLPSRFTPAPLTASIPSQGAAVIAGGYGVTQDKDARSTGVFRTVSLSVIEPYGPSKLLVWASGQKSSGVCDGDSGGPLASGASVFALATWSTGQGASTCGALSQGVLLGPQKSWIDSALKTWGRVAVWP